MRNLKNSIRKCVKSFGYAFSGMDDLFKNENNVRYQVLAGITTIIIAFYLKVDKQEWGTLITMIGLVLTAEAFNTAIEKLCDFVHPEQHPVIGKVKDMAAGAVLLISITAAVIAGIIFGSRFI